MKLREVGRQARGVLPAELSSAADSVWASPASASAWLDVHGLEVDRRVLERGRASRHRAAVEVWALAHDWSRPWCVVNARMVPDWSRLCEAGVEADAGAGTMERLLAAGVRVE